MKSARKILNLSVLLSAGAITMFPSLAGAVPAFARRYNVKCEACHMIPPVLNEAGYMFKRLGYHFPPPLQPGKDAQRIIDIVRSEPVWSFENTTSFAVTDVSYTSNRATQEGQPSSSSSSINLAEWNAYWTGWIPDTNFWYYSEFDIVANSVVSPTLSNANFGYTGGTARSSWFAKAGRSHLQLANSTRAGALYSVLPSQPLMFETMSPTNFIVDQSPVGVWGGYTWASPRYSNILAVTGAVTNGLNADGSEILGNSTKNAKDVWIDADWWYAPESGVSFTDYFGRKFEDQNSGAPNQFTYYPTIRRQGAYGNYMIAAKVDVLAGYMHSRDDWEDPATAAKGFYLGNDYFGEVHYYIQKGFVLGGRYDKLNHSVTAGPGTEGTRQWSIGLEKIITPSGNIIGRFGYTDLSGKDVSSAVRSTNKTVQADIAFYF